MSQEKRVAVDISPTYPQRQSKGRFSDATLDQYIHEIKKHPQLPLEEVISLSRLVQQGIAATEKIESDDVVVSENELNTLLEIQKSGGEARNAIVMANTGLVFKMASYYHGRGIDYLDLIQAGNAGLIRAAEKYDPDSGYAFSTYANNWIKSFMSEEIHAMGRTIRIRRDISIQIQKLRLLNKEHENVHGKDMTNDEMAEAMDMTEEEVAELLMLEDRSSTTSLNKVLYSESDRQEESDKELNGAIDDPTAQVEERALDKVIEDTIIKEVHSLLAISTLDERSKEIVRMQFGIGYEKPMSLREIHKQVVGRFETISMLASAAIEHLRSEAALFEMDRLLDADSE